MAESRCSRCGGSPGPGADVGGGRFDGGAFLGRCTEMRCKISEHVGTLDLLPPRSESDKTTAATTNNNKATAAAAAAASCNNRSPTGGRRFDVIFKPALVLLHVASGACWEGPEGGDRFGCAEQEALCRWMGSRLGRALEHPEPYTQRQQQHKVRIARRHQLCALSL